METGLAQKNLYATWNQSYLYEYLLIADLTKEVSDQVMGEKQAFFKQFGYRTAIKTKPHITIANFLAKEAMEETILRYIQRICSEQTAFNVMLNNFSGFPPDTIYIRVQDPHPFRQI